MSMVDWACEIVTIVAKSSKEDATAACSALLVGAAPNGDATAVCHILGAIQMLAASHHRQFLLNGAVCHLTSLIRLTKNMKIKITAVKTMLLLTEPCCVPEESIKEMFERARTGHVLDQLISSVDDGVRSYIEELYGRMNDTPAMRKAAAERLANSLIEQTPSTTKPKPKPKPKQSFTKRKVPLPLPKPLPPKQVIQPAVVHAQPRPDDFLSDEEVILMERIVEFLDNDVLEFGNMLTKLKNDYAL